MMDVNNDRQGYIRSRLIHLHPIIKIWSIKRQVNPVTWIALPHLEASWVFWLCSLHPLFPFVPSVFTLDNSAVPFWNLIQEWRPPAVRCQLCRGSGWENYGGMMFLNKIIGLLLSQENKRFLWRRSMSFLCVSKAPISIFAASFNWTAQRSAREGVTEGTTGVNPNSFDF